MPLTKRRSTAWARGLDIPTGGETILYTGQMYQLMPSIESLEGQMARFENSWVRKTMGLGRLVNKIFNTSRFMSKPDRREQDAFDRRLRNIALLLRQAGVEFGYLYGKELYAGALIYDQGITDVFEAHARKVHALLKRFGVKQVITVDPHTTDMLHHVYPKVIPGFDIEVKSYIEILADKGMTARKQLKSDIVLHDSCVYARYEDVVDQPRSLLKNAGVSLWEQQQSGKLTQCCGGPIEALFPEKAKAVARERLKQLEASGCANIATACPICLVNLRNAAAGNGATVQDISELLVEAYCPADQSTQR